MQVAPISCHQQGSSSTRRFTCFFFSLGSVSCNRSSGVKQNNNIEEIDFNHNLVLILPVTFVESYTYINN